MTNYKVYAYIGAEDIKYLIKLRFPHSPRVFSGNTGHQTHNLIVQRDPNISFQTLSLKVIKIVSESCQVSLIQWYLYNLKLHKLFLMIRILLSSQCIQNKLRVTLLFNALKTGVKTIAWNSSWALFYIVIFLKRDVPYFLPRMM